MRLSYIYGHNIKLHLLRITAMGRGEHMAVWLPLPEIIEIETG